MSRKDAAIIIIFAIFTVLCIAWGIWQAWFNYGECLKVGHSALYCLLHLGGR